MKESIRLSIAFPMTMADLSAYEAYLAGGLEDPEFNEADIDAALARLPEVPAPA